MDRNQSRGMERNKIDLKLLHILSTEISRDGGSSLVRDLKDYDAQIGSLLKRSGKSKLLAFLEQYPAAFDVDRSRLPHIVQLISDEFLNVEGSSMMQSLQRMDEFKRLEQEQQREQQQAQQQQAHIEDDLMNRIICVLRKESSKNLRRNKAHHNYMEGVNLSWLLKQCKGHFHRYLRYTGYYQRVYNDCREVKMVGSKEWMDLVMKEFVSLAQNICHIHEGRAHLQQEDDPAADLDVEEIAEKITKAVEEDGGTHISLSLLLHRYPKLRNILGGCDLMQMNRNYPTSFKDLHIFVKDANVFIQSKILREGRMEVDETGLFSVASSKWGNAFANMMAYHCSSKLSKDPKETIAIDLTASVGGVTLPLAKTFWKVIAVEIDSHRATLCRRNMETYGVEKQVDIRNEDSVEIIPDLAEELALPGEGDVRSSVVIIDPPWGGMHYKSEKELPVMMGKWTMVQVVERIARYLTPTVVGIRMPVSYDAGALFESLRHANVLFEADVKKAGPQLFIILFVNKNLQALVDDRN